MTDEFKLERFIEAQTDHYEVAFAEIRAGAKRNHWMWFIFLQLFGLGHSDLAKFYSIKSRDEALAYLSHPLLGRRLCECVAALQDLRGTTAGRVFGDVDAIKLRSSLTLFHETRNDELFGAALERWCGGKDPATLNLLAALDARNGR